MTVMKKPKNPEDIAFNEEPVLSLETSLAQFRLTRPRSPRPPLPAIFFNSTYFDSFFQRCNYCVTKYFNLEPWDLTLGFYDKDYCSCSLKRIVNRVHGLPENTGLNGLPGCPHRQFTHNFSHEIDN